MARPRYKPPTGPERLLVHALGLGEYKHEPYRNHFVAGAGHLDVPELDGLVERGLMSKREPAPGWLPGGSIVYVVTDAGRALALQVHREALPKLTRAQKRYEQWLDLSEFYDFSFGEWLRRGCPVPQLSDEPWWAR